MIIRALAFTLLSVVTFTSFPVSAQQLLDSYIARIGPRDHFNSNGKRLKSAAAIIRQDRANVHKFGRADPEDEYDSYFGLKANRARMEKMLRNGGGSKAAIKAIINSTPLIRVKIYHNRVTVKILYAS